MSQNSKTIWQHYHHEHHATLELGMKDWLLYPGSFMQRLEQYGIIGSRVEVLSQHWQLPTLEERRLLGLRERTYVLVREVLIHSPDATVMFARTVFPACTLTGKHRRLAKLKNRSLGTLLFSDPTMRREEFEIACLRADMAWYQNINRVTEVKLPEIWARRSMFHLGGKSLLLMEAFLFDGLGSRH